MLRIPAASSITYLTPDLVVRAYTLGLYGPPRTSTKPPAVADRTVSATSSVSVTPGSGLNRGRQNSVKNGGGIGSNVKPTRRPSGRVTYTRVVVVNGSSGASRAESTTLPGNASRQAAPNSPVDVSRLS